MPRGDSESDSGPGRGRHPSCRPGALRSSLSRQGPGRRRGGTNSKSESLSESLGVGGCLGDLQWEPPARGAPVPRLRGNTHTHTHTHTHNDSLRVMSRKLHHEALCNSPARGRVCVVVGGGRLRTLHSLRQYPPLRKQLQQRAPKFKVETNDGVFVLQQDNEFKALYKDGSKAQFQIKSNQIKVTTKYGLEIQLDLLKDISLVSFEIKNLVMKTIRNAKLLLTK